MPRPNGFNILLQEIKNYPVIPEKQPELSAQFINVTEYQQQRNKWSRFLNERQGKQVTLEYFCRMVSDLYGNNFFTLNSLHRILTQTEQIDLNNSKTYTKERLQIMADLSQYSHEEIMRLAEAQLKGAVTPKTEEPLLVAEQKPGKKTNQKLSAVAEKSNTLKFQTPTKLVEEPKVIEFPEPEVIEKAKVKPISQSPSPQNPLVKTLKQFVRSHGLKKLTESGISCDDLLDLALSDKPRPSPVVYVLLPNVLGLSAAEFINLLRDSDML